MYVSRRKHARSVVVDDINEGPSSTAGEIIEMYDAIDTGLLDEAGNPIYRVRDPIRLGFETNDQAERQGRS